MYRALIVGAGKGKRRAVDEADTPGLGLALAKRYIEREATVYCTYRTEANASGLRELQSKHADRVHIFQLDITDEERCQAVADEVKALTDSLDLVFVSAATFGDIRGGASKMTSGGLLDALKINTVGAHTISLKFSPFLIARAKENGTKPQLAFMTAGFGSLQAIDRVNALARQMLSIDYDAPAPAYSISKSSLSMLALQWAGHLNPLGVQSFVIHPGAVYRGEGKPPAAFMVPLAQCIDGLIAEMAGLTLEKSRSGIISYDADNLYPF